MSDEPKNKIKEITLDLLTAAVMLTGGFIALAIAARVGVWIWP